MRSPAHDRVFFHGDHQFMAVSQFPGEISIKRFYKPHIYKTCTDTGSDYVAGLETTAKCQYHDILAPFHYFCFANG